MWVKGTKVEERENRSRFLLIQHPLITRVRVRTPLITRVRVRDRGRDRALHGAMPTRHCTEMYPVPRR